MMNTFRSEWRKLTSVRMWIGLAVVAVAFAALNGIVLISTAGSGAEEFGSASRALYGVAGSAPLFALILGILALTSEYRHKTITSTLLATPKRGRLVVAKMAAAAVLGAVIGLLCLLASLALVFIGSAVKDLAPVDWGEFASVGGGVLLGCTLFAILGVGFGSLVRNQIAAVIAALAWFFIAESLFAVLRPEISKWLPNGALAGLLQQGDALPSDYFLPVPLAALVLLGYAAVFGTLGATLTMRRDIG